MFESLEIFQLAVSRAQHASARQAVVASNIANADTPGFRAQDLKSFNETYRSANQWSVGLGMTATRAGHLAAEPAMNRALDAERIDRPSGASPNGNTVSMDMELLHSIEADRAHNRAVTIYQTALGILRTAVRTNG